LYRGRRLAAGGVAKAMAAGWRISNENSEERKRKQRMKMA
jgi:hypothetical protein